MTHTKRKDIDVAVHLLMEGYEEEINLYSAIRDITLRQKTLLGHKEGIGSFCDLLHEKEEVLNVIDRLDSEMMHAKNLVMRENPDHCPHRWRLAALLDSLQDMIEDIRDAERDNADLLEAVPA